MFPFFLFSSVFFVSMAGKFRLEEYELPEKFHRRFCVDNASLDIDALIYSSPSNCDVFFRDDSNKTYATYSKCKRSDHFPVFIHFYTPADGIKQVDFSGEYKFVNEYGVYLAKDGDRWRFGGFNQVWLGCPQPMCLHAKIDAAFSDSEIPGRFIITRGNHFWVLDEIKITPESKNAIQQTVNFADSGLKRAGGLYYIFKGKYYFTSKNLSHWSHPKLIEELFGHQITKLPLISNSDAAVSLENNTTIFFKGTNCYAVGNGALNSFFTETKLPKEITYIDAAVKAHSNLLLLFKKRQYGYVHSILEFGTNGTSKLRIEQVGGLTSVNDFFKCDYSETLFRDRQNYEDIIGKYIDEVDYSLTTKLIATTTVTQTTASVVMRDTSTTTSGTTTVTTAASKRKVATEAWTLSTTEPKGSIWTNSFVFALIIILIFASIVLIIFVVLEFKKERGSSQIQRKSISERTISTPKRQESISSFDKESIGSAEPAMIESSDTIGQPPDKEHSIIKPKKVSILKYGTLSSEIPKQ